MRVEVIHPIIKLGEIKMAKMLDLSVFTEQTFDIRFAKDDILHVKKPTEGIAIKILSQADIKSDDMTVIEMLDITKDMTLTILNNNNEGRIYNDKFVSDKLPLNLRLAIIQGYSEFMTELEQNPNS